MNKPVVLCACGCKKITPIAPCTRPSRGWIKGEHVEYFPHHSKNLWPVSDGMSKQCRKCLEVLPVDKFDKHTRSADGLQSKCKPCAKQLSYHYRRTDGGLVRFVVARRKNHLSRYRITPEEYDRMLLEQDGLCAICQRPETERRKGILKKLAVDHCHNSGAVRGLLCSACNHAIGKLQDSPAILRRAAEYLER